MSQAATQDTEPTEQALPDKIGEDQTLIYLVRHGQTEWNVERRFQGQLDVPLSEVGEQQAEALADWLGRQPVQFGALYSSDLERAQQTAQPIGKRLGLVPELVPAIREIHVGEWQGLLSAEVEQRYPEQLAQWRAHRFKVPGGESIHEVQQRLALWYAEATAAHRGQAIVVVTHGMALTALLAALNKWDLTNLEQLKPARSGNTGVTVVLADHVSSLNRTLLMNSLEHLPADTELAALSRGAKESQSVMQGRRDQ